MLTKLLSAFVLALFLSSCSGKPTPPDSSASGESIKIEHTYKALKILDLDQMSDLLYEKADDYKKNNRTEALREGAIIAFSRPNEEVILDKIVSIVKAPLEDMGEWNSTVEQMVEQSIQTIKNDAANATAQVTASVILENLLSEFKPQFVKQYQSGGFETSIIERIAAANLQFSKQAMQEKKLNQMRTGLTPSQLAQKLIDIKNKKIEEQKK